MSIRIALRAMVLVLLSVAVATAARAADTVKVAIGQIDAWANQEIGRASCRERVCWIV